MQTPHRFDIADGFTRAAEYLNLNVKNILRRAKLPAGLLDKQSKGVTGPQYFQIWDGMVAEAADPQFPATLARTLARGPFIPAIYAFSCSANISEGLQRLADFKPLMAPVSLDARNTTDGFSITIRSAEPGLDLPHSLCVFEVCYLMECMRNFSGHQIVPLHATLPLVDTDKHLLAEILGRSAVSAPLTQLVLSREDAQRPLLSANPEFLSIVVEQLDKKLAVANGNRKMTERVKDALIDLLPAGKSSADTVAAHLATSKRTLQRKLSEEGVSFQQVLDATRSELSLFYLSNGELSVEEISFLLAFRDPNSFYRAFHTWTGMTPTQARNMQPQ